jgi:hypothetical protein
MEAVKVRVAAGSRHVQRNELNLILRYVSSTPCTVGSSGGSALETWFQANGCLTILITGHMVDATSWPLYLESHPELAQKGSYGQAFQYYPAQVKEVIQFANAWGVDVIIEIDVPGHSAAIGESHPEHVACFHDFWNGGKAVAVEPPAGQLRFANAATTNFTTSVIASVLNLTTSQYFSHGGDEVNQNCFVSCPSSARLPRSSC